MIWPVFDSAASSGGVYFVTANTFARRPLFQTDRVARFFLETLCRRRDEVKFRLHEFVIMPDHVLLLLTPPPHAGLERVIQLIQGGFSYRLRKELELNLQVWERDYATLRMRDADEYGRHVRYIWRKPVEARLALAAEYYPYGSARGDVLLDPYPEELRAEALMRA